MTGRTPLRASARRKGTKVAKSMELWLRQLFSTPLLLLRSRLFPRRPAFCPARQTLHRSSEHQPQTKQSGHGCFFLQLGCPPGMKTSPMPPFARCHVIEGVMCFHLRSPVDHGCGDPGPEAVVDIDHGNARHACVQHCKHCREPLDSSAVACAGWNRDNGLVHQAADH